MSSATKDQKLVDEIKKQMADTADFILPEFRDEVMEIFVVIFAVSRALKRFFPETCRQKLRAKFVPLSLCVRWTSLSMRVTLPACLLSR